MLPRRIPSLSPLLVPALLASCLTARAFGRDNDSNGQASSPIAAEKTYRLSREDIRNFHPPSFGDPYGAGLGRGVMGMIKEIGNDATVNAKLLDLQTKYRPASFADQMLSVAAHQPASDANRVDAGQGVTKELGSGMQRNVERQVLSYATFVSVFKQGLNFRLKPSSWFGGDDSKGQASVGTAQDNVRYGLILKSIEANPNGYKTAAVNDITMEELQAAAKAKLEWTIGPVAQTDQTRLFNVSRQDARPYVPKPKDGSLWSTVKYYWDTTKLPSANIQGNIAPVTPDAQTAPQAMDTKGLPPMRFSLWQEEEYYRYEYLTDGKGKKASANHILGFYAYKRMRLTQTRNENMKVTKTSLLNVLADDKAPLINVYYLDLEKRYQADYTYRAQNLEVIVTMDTPKGWRVQRAFREKNEKYELKINKAI